MDQGDTWTWQKEVWGKPWSWQRRDICQGDCQGLSVTLGAQSEWQVWKTPPAPPVMTVIKEIGRNEGIISVGAQNSFFDLQENKKNKKKSKGIKKRGRRSSKEGTTETIRNLQEDRHRFLVRGLQGEELLTWLKKIIINCHHHHPTDRFLLWGIWSIKMSMAQG